MTDAVDVLPRDRMRGQLGPLRRAVLAALQERPASAASIAARLDASRQRVNYHVRELERAGLVELVETRPRRGFRERVLRATARAVVPEPELQGDIDGAVEAQDGFAAETLIALSARTASDVARMRRSAAGAEQRLVTFAIEAEVGFHRPSDIQAFAKDLAEAVATLAERYGRGGAQRSYRVVLGGYPTPHGMPRPPAAAETEAT
ncbi:MAG: ArsR/SmtB family transcription factor [Sandaracinaceae bacterium]